MRIQISSGQGPAECELAAGLFYEELKKEAPDIRLISFTQGKKREGFSSIVFETEHDLPAWRAVYCGFAGARTVRSINGRTGMWM